MFNFKLGVFLLGFLLAGNAFSQIYVNVFDFMTAAEIADVQAGTENINVAPKIQNAIDSFPGSYPKGLLYFPAGTYRIDSTIIMMSDVSLKGESFKASKLAFNGTGPILSYDQTYPGYGWGQHIEDLWLEGTGANNDSTNDGIMIDHYMGHDYPVFKNLIITDCGGFGINASQIKDNSMHNAFQFAHFDTLHIKDCKNGMRIGEGFCGETLVDNLTIEGCNIGLEVMYAPAINEGGAQGFNFRNFVADNNNKGVLFSGATAGIIKFENSHFESNDIYGVEFADSGTRHVVFENCWFDDNPTAVYGSDGGMIEFVSCNWNTASATDRWIHLTNTSNFKVNINGFQWEGITLNTPIQAVDIAAIKGNMKRKTSTKGAFSHSDFTAAFQQSRSISSEYALVRGNNLTGKKSIGNNDSSILVTFDRSEPDTSYNIIATVGRSVWTSYWSPMVSVGNKKTTGFRVYFNSPPGDAGYILNWMLVR